MATPYRDREITLEPAMNPGDEAWFDAAAQGRLLVRKCRACNRYHHYPRAICPHCFSGDVEWIEAKGTGIVYSCTVTRRAGPVAYCLAYVTLDEGPTMLTNIVDCDLDSVRIGQRVEVTFKRSAGGATLPMFKPA